MKKEKFRRNISVKKIIFIFLRGSIILGSGYGVLDQIGIFRGIFNGQQLMYYTILSNSLVSIFYILLSISHIKQKKRTNHKALLDINKNVKGAFTMMILVTGIIYHIILVPTLSDTSQYGLYTFSNFLVHTYVPGAVFLDWVLFTPIKTVKKLEPFKWLIIPLSYWILSIMYASLKIPFFQTESYYAYFFIDNNALGWPKTLMNIFILSIFFLVIGYFLIIVKVIEYWINEFKT
ncbi:TPA: Pr6Pr family membrane protein [Enterococcus faecalis]